MSSKKQPLSEIGIAPALTDALAEKAAPNTAFAPLLSVPASVTVQYPNLCLLFVTTFKGTTNLPMSKSNRRNLLKNHSILTITYVILACIKARFDEQKIWDKCNLFY